ncbi:MAG: hypothetical protein [Siphoviridae sp. ctjeG17]|nr:MAG: hypothetical protein [Siphoviridae sp. ctjeG17]
MATRSTTTTPPRNNPFAPPVKSYEQVAKEVTQPSTPQPSTPSTPSQSSQPPAQTSTTRRHYGGAPIDNTQAQQVAQANQAQKEIDKAPLYYAEGAKKTGVQLLSEATAKTQLQKEGNLTPQQLERASSIAQKEEKLQKLAIIQSGRTTAQATPQEAQRLQTLQTRAEVAQTTAQQIQQKDLIRQQQEKQQAQAQKDKMLNDFAPIKKEQPKAFKTYEKYFPVGATAIKFLSLDPVSKSEQERRYAEIDIQKGRKLGTTAQTSRIRDATLGMTGGGYVATQAEVITEKTIFSRLYGSLTQEYGEQQATKYVSKASTKAGEYLERGGQKGATDGEKIARYIAGGVYQAPKTLAVGITASEVAGRTATATSTEKEYLQSKEYKSTLQDSERRKQEALNKQLKLTGDERFYEKVPEKTLRFFANQGGLRPIFEPMTKVYASEEAYYISQGATPSQAREAVRTQKAKEYSLLASGVAVNALTELGGRGMISTAFRGTTSATGTPAITTIAKNVAPALLTQGAIEGGAQYLGQAQARDEQITFKEFGKQSAYGALQATALGVPIGITSIGRKSASPEIIGLTRGTTAQKLTSASSYGISGYANVADYQEIFGDKAIDLLQGSTNKYTRGARNPIITLSGTNVNFGSDSRKVGNIATMGQTKTQTQTKQNTQTKQPPINIGVKTPFNMQFSINQVAQMNIPERVPNKIKQPFGTPPSTTIPQINQNIFLQFPEQQNIPQEVTTKTNVPTNISVPFNTNVSTGGLFFPPLPLTFPSGSAGGGKRTGGKGYINELSRAFGVISTPQKQQSKTTKQQSKFTATNAVKKIFGKGGRK